MISKQKHSTSSGDKFEQAGDAAEEQMAFYLRRAFGDVSDVFVFNDLRLVEEVDAAQIDHLVVHCFGMFIVESKSISGEVTVDHRDEWTRTWAGRREGMKSPIQQAKLQADFLRKRLNEHKEQLRDKRIFGKAQPSFRSCPIKVIAAISDNGIINRIGGADPSELCKADHVVERIRGEIERHRKAAKLLSRPDGDYGVWELTPNEMGKVVTFLLNRHVPLNISRDRTIASPVTAVKTTPLPPKTKPAETPLEQAVCKGCNGIDLHVASGPHSYYFKCNACDKNTPIDFACRSCGKKAKIRKQGPNFVRVCEACTSEQLFWINSEESIKPKEAS